MRKKFKRYFDSSNPDHIEAMEAASRKAKKLNSAENKVQDAYGMLTLIQSASHHDVGIISLEVGDQIDKIVPLLESALKKLDKHGIDHQRIAFKHYLGGSS